MKHRFVPRSLNRLQQLFCISTAWFLISCQAPQPTVYSGQSTEIPVSTNKPLFVNPSSIPKQSEQAMNTIQDATAPSLLNKTKVQLPTQTDSQNPQSASNSKQLISASSRANQNGKTLIPISSIHVPADFDYATSREVTVDITVHNPNGAPYSKVMVALYAPDEMGLNPMVRGVTDPAGHYQDLIKVPYYLQNLDVQISGFGIANSKRVQIQNKQLQAKFGPMEAKK